MKRQDEVATFGDIERIFGAALAIPPEQRRQRAAELCNGNEEILAEVMSLLEADAKASGFLDSAVTASPVRAEPLPAGTHLGHYEILSLIGTGAMGEVYRSRDTRLGRSVAIKTLSSTLAGNRDALARFTREARAASSLNHPGIVQVYDIGSVSPENGDTIHYIAMELIEGVTLRDRFRAPGDLRERLALLVQVATAVGKAHQAGITHRDLKPENIMVATGEVKVVDFGLAKLTEPPCGSPRQTLETRAGVMMGTAGYMSPEQVQGHPASHRSDIFSLGCIIHEAVTGRGPFDGNGFIDTLHKIVHSPAPRLAALHPAVPRTLQPVIDRCVEKDPADRFQSMAELANALGDVLRKVGDSRVIVPYAGRAPRARAGRTAAVLGLLLFALVAGLLVQRLRQQPLVRPERAQPAVARPVRSLAIMPFSTTRGAPETQYLADGLTEDLIDRLSRFEALRVTPRSRAMQYRGRVVTDATIRRELEAHAALRGRLQRRGDAVIVNVDLIDLRSGARLWGNEYRRPFHELSAIETDILRAVAEALRPGPAAGGRGLYRQRTSNVAAYDHVLKGRYYWNQWTENGWREALRQFEAAAQIDPLYSLAYAGISDTCTQLAFYGFMPVAEAWTQAKSAAVKAIALDETLGEAHMSLGVVYTWFEHDYDKADREYRRAVELSPNNPEVWLAYNRHLGVLQRYDEAIRAIERAHQLNPVSIIIESSRSNTFLLAGRHEEALRIAQRMIEMNPSATEPLWDLGNAYTALGRSSEAVGAFLELDQRRGVPAKDLAKRRERFSTGGLPAYWLATAHWSAARAKRGQTESPGEISRAYVLAGDFDRALEWVEQAYTKREPLLLWINSDPVWTPLRSDPRFIAVLRKLRLGG